MFKLRLFTGFLLVAALFVGDASARDIFVDNLSGDDRYDGGTPDNGTLGTGPTRTIAKALRIARPSDRIILAKNDTPYRECISLVGANHSGTPGKEFTIIGNGAIIDGSRPIDTDAWSHESKYIFSYEPQDSTHPMLYADGAPLKYVQPGPGKSLPALKPLEWTFLADKVYLRTESPKLPSDYNLSEPGHAVGVTLYKAVHVIIDDVVVQNFRLDGIAAADVAQSVSLVGVVARGNGRSGIHVAGASQVDIYASLLFANGGNQIRVDGFSTTRIINCEVDPAAHDPEADAIFARTRSVEVEVINDP